MTLKAIEPPGRTYSWWLTNEEVGQMLGHHRGWRLSDHGGVVGGKVLHKNIAPSLEVLGAAALISGWVMRASVPHSDGRGPTHFMWGVFDARSESEIAAQVKLVIAGDATNWQTPAH